MTSNTENTPRKTKETRKNEDGECLTISTKFALLKDQNRCQEDEILGKNSLSGSKKVRLTDISNRFKNKSAEDIVYSQDDLGIGIENEVLKRKLAMKTDEGTINEGCVTGTRNNRSNTNMDISLENPGCSGENGTGDGIKQELYRNMDKPLENPRCSGDNGPAIKQEVHSSKFDVKCTYKAEYTKSKRSELFSVTTTYKIPIAKSLLQQYKSMNNHGRKDFSGLRINLNNDHRELVNPNCPSGWFNGVDKKVVFEFAESLCDIPTHRDYSLGLHKTWHSFYVDQRKGVMKIPGLKFSYPGVIRVDGTEDETILEALKKDGRFMDSVFQKKALMDTNCEHQFTTPIKDVDGCYMTLVSSQSRYHTSTKRVINNVKNEMPGQDLNHPIFNESFNQVGSDVNNSVAANTETLEKSEDARSLPLLKMNTFQGSLEEIIEALNKLNKDINWKKFLHGEKSSFPERKKLKNFIGKFSSHFDHSCDFELMEELCKWGTYVCHLKVPIPGTNHFTYGTAFVVGVLQFDDKDHLIILTCYHVLNETVLSVPKLANQCGARFLYHNNKQLDPNDPKAKLYPIKLDSMLASDKKLDYVLLALDYSEDLLRAFDVTKRLGMQVNQQIDMPGNGQILRLIGHPNGEVKKVDQLVVIRDPQSEMMFALRKQERHDPAFLSDSHLTPITDPQRMYYQCSSFHGASGSPCFDQYGNIICMHTGGFWLDERDKAANKKSNLEIGVPLFFIVQDIIQKAKKNPDHLKMAYVLFPRFKPQEPVPQPTPLFA